MPIDLPPMNLDPPAVIRIAGHWASQSRHPMPQTKGGWPDGTSPPPPPPPPSARSVERGGPRGSAPTVPGSDTPSQSRSSDRLATPSGGR